MVRQKIITFQKALDQRIVKENNYFLIKYPDGRERLFRLVNTEKGYVMLGPPTEKKVRFCGKSGYDELFALADDAVKKEYSLPEIFEDAYACSLSEKNYEVHSYGEIRRILVEEGKKHIHPDDKEMTYALASRCACFYNNSYANFYLFRISNGNAGVNSLYRFDNEPWYFNYAVRPEVIPKPTMHLKMEECNGSKEKPWVCVYGQNDLQENGDMNASNGTSNVSKDEIIRIIEEGCQTREDVQEVIRMLEEYAENLE